MRLRNAGPIDREDEEGILCGSGNSRLLEFLVLEKQLGFDGLLAFLMLIIGVGEAF